MKTRLLIVIVTTMLNCMPFCLMAAQQSPTDDKTANPDQADNKPTLKPRPEDGFKKPLIRHDWTDVLNSSEDLSQTDTGHKSYDDLTGAVFSYAHDSQNSSDNWTAEGAVIVPYVKHQDLKYGSWSPILFVAAPSLTLNKISSSGNASNDVDHLDTRLGFYSKWLPQENVFTGLLFRGALVYGTDTGFHASLPAAELELEPQFWWGSDKWSIGYQNNIIMHKDKDDKGNIIIKPLLTYQLRGWLRVEGGDLQRNNANWETVDGSFFRAGPELQGAVNFSNELIKGFIKGASLTVNYGYMPAISGPSGNSSLLKICAALTLYENDTDHQKISLTASFQNGGLDLSKQEVEVFNIGIGVIF